jgi:hypothetical protein
VVDSIYAVEDRLKTQIKAVADDQKAFRDAISEIKQRQGQVLLYLGLAATLGAAVVGTLVKFALDAFWGP